jgi:hypothetical protein
MIIDCLNKSGERNSNQRNRKVILINGKLKTADAAWAWSACDQLCGEQSVPLDTVLYHSFVDDLR